MDISPWKLPPHLKDENPDDYEAFVYIITNLKTGRSYIGKKFTTATRKGRKVTSDWPRYFGSSKDLSRDVAEFGKSEFSREILSLHTTRQSANFTEIEEQFSRKVLTAQLPDGSRAYYNKNIMGKFFCSPEKLSQDHIDNLKAAMTPERRAKIGLDASNRKMSPDNKRKLSERMSLKKGWKHSEAAREKISNSRSGIKISEAGRASLTAARARNAIDKLTESQKIEIREIRSSSETNRQLATRFGRSIESVRRIRSGECYGSLH